ncbi:hypothetical protein D6779_09795 [Candidatus Parcubacteria bacterium]|nr:MAG: hypothetical protein D6779_09795 [Candidatus Parcubacteria bacterium]
MSEANGVEPGGGQSPPRGRWREHQRPPHARARFFLLFLYLVSRGWNTFTIMMLQNKKKHLGIKKKHLGIIKETFRDQKETRK